MIKLRPSMERGFADHGWLKSKHSFSFAGYHDPEHMGYSVLRVINDDAVEPGMGFGMHGHSNMEIITYVLSGELEHKDSLGNGSIIRPGDVQRMSAGTGIRHSEFNPSADRMVHLLQIWILPERQGVEPSYEQKAFSVEERSGKLRLVASRDGREESVTVQTDVSLYASILDANEPITWSLQAGRCAYLHVAKGSLEINGQLLRAGDAAKIVNEDAIVLSQAKAAEILLFDLPV
ncbi:MAG: pirin family protein [Methylophilales bacterium]|nr:pirin family protein [Methylophilales bacterium]